MARAGFASKDEECSGPLIVVVEDEAIVLAGYQMLFESWGYRVIAVPSADEALHALRECNAAPQFILADYRLRNEQTGAQAIAILRDSFGAGIPGVLVTGDTGPERLRSAAASGLPLLHKPVQARQLLDLLERSLTGSP